MPSFQGEMAILLQAVLIDCERQGASRRLTLIYRRLAPCRSF